MSDTNGALTDVSAETPDLNPEDRVYLAPNGYRVKVKALLREDPAAAARGVAGVVELSGSIVGSDGKALRRQDGAPAVWALGATHHFMAEGDDDPVQALEAARRRCAAEAIRAEAVFALTRGHVEGAPGLATREAFEARKAAEAAATGATTKTGAGDAGR